MIPPIIVHKRIQTQINFFRRLEVHFHFQLPAPAKASPDLLSTRKSNLREAYELLRTELTGTLRDNAFHRTASNVKQVSPLGSSILSMYIRRKKQADGSFDRLFFRSQSTPRFNQQGNYAGNRQRIQLCLFLPRFVATLNMPNAWIGASYDQSLKALDRAHRIISSNSSPPPPLFATCRLTHRDARAPEQNFAIAAFGMLIPSGFETFKEGFDLGEWGRHDRKIYVKTMGKQIELPKQQAQRKQIGLELPSQVSSFQVPTAPNWMRIDAKTPFEFGGLRRNPLQFQQKALAHIKSAAQCRGAI
ncbi:hypothetical protein R3P38DRAFT_2778802 [Favolaschia claudopus]|uniref:Ribosomal protein S3 n=1 Tax=Favolaschia claudopus TaxID=2862362 RepID=A0AAW0BFT4_9AGAR